MTPKLLLLENHEPGICVIKINRPEALNALNTEVLRELKTVLSQEAARAETRVIVLTGAGVKSFIAGADIREMKDKSASEAVQLSMLGHQVAQLLEQMPKPTIAAVNGYALGGGTEMAISCDFILASENAVFGLPEVGLGVIPGFGGTIRLARFVGVPRAKELIFSGRKISSHEALSYGLANNVYPQEGFLERVLELARLISQQSSHAVRRSKQLLVEFSETTGLNYKTDAEALAFGHLFETPDQREGMNAFLEKRIPQFEGLKPQVI